MIAQTDASDGKKSEMQKHTCAAAWPVYRCVSVRKPSDGNASCNKICKADTDIRKSVRNEKYTSVIKPAADAKFVAK